MGTIISWFAVLRHLGAGWVLYRIAYWCRLRSGSIRRASPVQEWGTVRAPELRLARRQSLPRDDAWARAAVSEADGILAGSFVLFSWKAVEAGKFPAWHRNPQTREAVAYGKHWSRTGKGAGDIKEVWELSRFGWAFALARAFARTGSSRYAGRFWELWGNWVDANAPNQGPNWMCGQEATFRLMAVVFAAEVCGVPEARRETLSRFVVGSGRRIAANLSYALSQKNNHGVSECVGLVTAGLLIPGDPDGTAWMKRGEQELAAQLDELVYPDGAFSQHSLVYHRVLLHDLVWCASRYDAAGMARPVWLDAAGSRALEFLIAIVDPETGSAPLYGANDGASVLPLADGEFLDFRPVVQMAAAVFRRELPLPSGRWDEAAAWMVPDWEQLPRVAWPVGKAVRCFPDGGCAVLRLGADQLFFRCPTQFRHRPSQVDMLHVDIRLQHREVTMDGGSFSYDSVERFTALGAASHHNVLVLDGVEPMRKFRRFLYLPWTEGTRTVTARSVTAAHDGYSSLGVGYVRTVELRGEGGFTVRDLVRGAAGHDLRWHWRLAEGDWKVLASEVRLATTDGWTVLRWRTDVLIAARLVRADPASATGWWSPRYGEARPATALILECSPDGDVGMEFEFFTTT